MSMAGRALTRRGVGAAAGAALVAGAVPVRAAGAARPWPYLIGADVSWIPEDEHRGATFTLDGERRDPLVILAAAGFNAVKLRLFVDPTRGYARRKPGGPWCGLDSTIAFARRVRARGMHLSLTIHYSDTWADPEHQDKPAAWTGLPLPALAEAVRSHTRDSLAAMATAGVAPDMVVIGNETTFGMLWPDGRVPPPVPTGNPVTDARHAAANVAPGGWDRFAALLKAGLAGAREAAPEARLVVHNHLGRHWEIVRRWTDALVERDVRFDAVGFSCYQQQAAGDWARTFEAFERHYPNLGFLVLEYSSRKRYVNDLVHGRGAGWGGFIWEPTRHQEAIFTQGGESAGEGPRPDLIAGGVNAAEAPGSTPPAQDAPRRRVDPGGRFDADPRFVELYRTMARDYGLTPVARPNA